MEYRVSELAAAAGVSVDTVRYYQAHGLLHGPKRSGRHALYTEHHLARLKKIRRLQRDGLPLGVIRRLLTGKREEAALVRALEESGGERRMTRPELAAEAGVPEALIGAVADAGIVEPVRVGGEERYGSLEVEMARAGLALLREGVPLTELLALAIHQADATREVVDRAIELFDKHVRRDRSGEERDAAEVIEAFERLLPTVVGLVARHFHRTLVARALARLEANGDRDGLAHALTATAKGRLELRWR
jgi:DNA-binding transcriptional MerR regulator